jgi:hypothetical protein
MASTTPPNDPGGPGVPPPGTGTAPERGAYTQISNFDVARMPIPGNAEFVVLVLIEAFLAILLLDDAWNTNDWAFASTILGAAYLLSRGIAKASRVLEQ